MNSILLLLISFSFIKARIISCYYTYNNPPTKDIDVDLCSHIILIGNSNVDNIGGFQPPPKEILEDFLSLKARKPSLKLLLCLTGSNPNFSLMVSDSETMFKFANDSANYLYSNGLDGLDIDWEFPTWSGDAKKTDRLRLSKFLELLRSVYSSKFLITAAVSGPPTISRVAYDIPAFNKFLDFVQVMNYDFHVFSYISNPFVGFNAPLRKMKGEVGIIGQMNSEASMRTYAIMGLWQNITLFGIPTYNLAYRLVNRFWHKPYAPAIGSVYGYDTHPEICKLPSNESYRYVWNDQASSPYIYGKDKLWISIENERSVKEKALFARNVAAGIMIFHIGGDDVHGECGNKNFPLIKRIRKAFIQGE